MSTWRGILIEYMDYQAGIADIEKNYLGKIVGSGQCVAFVQQTARVPTTIHWKMGRKIAGDHAIGSGTAIATFDPGGTYGNHIDGRSHAAIYVTQNTVGIVVYDQWAGQPVHKRTI